GPQQAWSSMPRRAVRPTQDHPTKSGVLGLVANALGRDRGDDISDLAALRYAVRGDRTGTVEVDFHTAGAGSFPLLPAEVLADRVTARAAANGSVRPRAYAAPKNIRRHGDSLTGKREAAILTRDAYLADAVFTAALTGDRSIIDQIAAALTTPARTLFLGRRAYPLSQPLNPYVVDDTDPQQVLTTAPPAPRAIDGPRPVWADANPVDAHDPAARIVTDQPTSYQDRRHRPRVEIRVRTGPARAFTPEVEVVDFFSPPEPT
uniref:type I-E CRISPR-associated protein Cas5/CasD n=1 Tax=Nocardia asiatica TaxID=209252 RepID=UPI0006867C5A